MYSQCWLPDTETKAALVIVHGIAEHCGRYANMVDYLVPRGYAVYGFDHRGHGKSAGRKGYVEDFSFFLEDLSVFLDRVRRRNQSGKIFLFGHSMGAAIVLAYAADYPNDLAGLILSGPAVRVKPGLPAAVVGLLQPLALFLPKLGLKKLDSSTLSHDRRVVEAYDRDPLVYRGKISARLTLGLLRAMHQLENRLSSIRLPLLVLHGGEDRMVDPESSRIVFTRAASADKTLKIYPGLYHEILNEPEHLKVLEDIESWLEKQV